MQADARRGGPHGRAGRSLYIAVMLTVVRALVTPRSWRASITAPHLGEQLAGARAGRGAAVGAGDRVHRHPRDLRRVPARRDHPARQPGRRRTSPTRIDDIVRVLFLPAFFAFTGMRTEIGLLETAGRTGWSARLIIVVATRRQVRRHRRRGAAVRPRLARQRRARHPDEHPRPDGADRAQHRPRPRRHLAALFTMLVIMALVTTMMTTPILMASCAQALRHALTDQRSTPANGQNRAAVV